MKISLNWIKEYVAFDWNAQQLAERLTMLGIEVESVEPLGVAFEGIVAAQILASEKHPNADRLTVCRVTDGQQERQIVCGATNYKVGDKVPLALPGTTLPDGLVIKISKLRGVESHGMLCSAKELKLLPAVAGSDDAAGLLILNADARVGAPLSEVIGSDTILDLEITPNRPDLLSHIGVAREISAVTGNPLKLPTTTPLQDSNSPIEEPANVVVEAADLCPRYTARVIRGIPHGGIGPSPDWLRQKLERIGQRSINNVVDITNFVLFEIGQPLHAFDLTLLEGRKLVIRRARAGEKIIALDGLEYKSDAEMLLIADAAKPVAIAGIMGGQGSEINDRTTDILLESAYFSPSAIRRASKKLGLRSESSYRFERGCDIGICDWASRRAAALIAELAGGKVATGVIDTNPNPKPPTPITCRYNRINRLLGIEVPRETTRKIFTGLGLNIANDLSAVAETTDTCVVQPPTFRVDLTNEADLAEEVCRLYGVDKIPAVAAPAHAAWSDADAKYDRLADIRSLLTGMGFWETISPILISESQNSIPQDRTQNAVARLKNPLSEELAILRPSLLPRLLTSLRVNVSRGNNDLRFFEIGRVFSADGEKLHLALAITGARAPAHWSGASAKADYYDLKGVLEKLRHVSRVGHGNVTSRGAPKITITQLSPQLACQYDLRDPVLVVEFDLNELLDANCQLPIAGYRELPRFPSVARDIAMIVSEAITHAQIVSAIQSAKPDWLEEVELFDIFRGKAIGTDKKSVAYRLTYRADDRTLTDVEVNRVHDKVKAALSKAIQCEIRE